MGTYYNADIVNQKLQDLDTKITNSISNLKTETTNLVQQSMPYGAIIMWHGNTSNIPSGWALCNGQNGTPNMTDRFVVGAGGSYGAWATGGNTTIKPSGRVGVSVDTHVLSWNEMPVHNHSYLQWRLFVDAGGGGWDAYAVGAGDGQNGSSGSQSSGTDNAGSSWGHNHGASGSFDGDVFDNRPLFFAICYIMKII